MSQATYHLHILGAARSEDAEGEAVSLPVGKPFALLAHLHLADRAIPRDTLASLFWPRSDRNRGRASVRQALWTLRKAFDEDLFETDDPVQLREGAVVSDVEDVRAALTQGHLDLALESWGGPPDPALRISDAPEWNQELDQLREELEQRVAGALSLEADKARATGNLDEARGHLEAACVIRPHQLRLWTELLDVLLDRRLWEEAAKVLTAARQQFEDEATLEEFEAYEARIQTLRQPAVQTTPDPHDIRLGFVGRSEEYDRLLGAWRRAQAGHPTVGLVTGPAGIGKTRLASEIARVAEAEGARVLKLKAEDSERPIEWGLLSELIQRLLRLSGAAGVSHASDAVLRALVPSLSHGDPDIEPARSRTSAGGLAGTRPSGALTDALADLLTAVSEDAPLFILVDDLHWADTESRTILARVAVRLGYASVLLLFTSRAETEHPRVRKTVRLLGDADGSATVDLKPWNTEDLGAALDQTLEFSEPERASMIRDRIYEVTRGNPLFVVELLKAFQADGILEGGDGSSPSDPAAGAAGPNALLRFHTEQLPPDLPLPDTLRALVDRQLDQLSEEAALVAAHLARIGHPASPRVIGLRTGMSTSAVTTGIGQLLERRMIRWEGDEVLTFMHDELRAAVARRYELHVGLTAGGGAQWSFFRTAVAASLTLLVLGAVAYLLSRPISGDPAIFGGGTVLLAAGSESEALRFGPDPDASFRLLRLSPVETDSLLIRFVGPTATLPLGSNSSPASGNTQLASADPDAVAGGRTLQPGDAILGLSPDGQHTIVSRQSDGSSGYHHLLLNHRRTGGERQVLRASRQPLLAELSPGGQRLALVLPGRMDRLLITTPAGQVVHGWSASRILDARWCGDEDMLVLTRDEGEIQATIWSPVDDRNTPVQTGEITLGRQAVCSPDGSAILLQGASGGSIGLFLLDRSSGSTWPLHIDPALPDSPERLVWVPDEIPAVPAAIRIAGSGSRVLGWGEQSPLSGELLFPDGTTAPDDLTWISRDPDVAFVAADGRVTGTRPGESWIVAEWNGWLRDSVWVHVTPFDDTGTMVRETFQDPSLPNWTHSGAPAEMHADGPLFGSLVAIPRSGPNGGPLPLRLLTREAFTLEDGATVEIEVELPLVDGAQGEFVAICMVRFREEAFPALESLRQVDRSFEPRSLDPDDIDRQACLEYPAREGSRWNPSELELRTHSGFPGVHLTPHGNHLPHEGWTHLAMTITTDGRVSAHLDRAHLGTSPVQIPNAGQGRWRILLYGASVEGGGRLQVRNLSLWSGTRYEIPGPS